MSITFYRIAAIVRSDFLLRFRRVSTLVCFLLLSALAYLWVPPPASGRALVVVNGQRAINNSGAVGLATASLGMIFIGLFGYYFISNAIRRDLTSRCGIIVASTPMRSAEYLFAKFLGNVAFLVTFLSGYMVSSMIMLLVRAEAPFEPATFVRQYLLLTPSAIVFVSAVAVLFESIPLLAGKLGDVLYFILWIGCMSFVIADQVSGGKFRWTRFVDISGFGFMIAQLRSTLHTESFAIGASNFDPTKAPVALPGLTLSRGWILPRIVSLLGPLTLLPVAMLFFHRFDPVRTRRLAEKSRRNWIGRLQRLVKPLPRRFVILLQPVVPGPPFLRAIWLDALLTFTLSPLAFIAWAGAVILGLASPPVVSVPLIVAAVCLVISDSATRDVRAATMANLRTVPRLRENLIWWKLGSSAVVSLLFLATPLLATASRSPDRIGPFLAGILFVVSTAISFGVLTSNPKTMVVAFLTFGYVVINDRGATPLLDFAGSYGTATRNTALLYMTVSVALIAAAEFSYRQRLRNS